MDPRERDLETRIRAIKELQTKLAMIPMSQAERERQEDYWQSELTQSEEQLYNLRHGDSKCLTSEV